MFVHLQGRTSLGLHPDQVVAIIESINNPNISVPGNNTEPAKAYIVGARLPAGTFTAFLYFHLLESNSVAIFCPQPHEVPLDHYPQLEVEAISFVESMGFMLDNLNFRARPPEDQATLQRTLPIFLDQPVPLQMHASMQAQFAPQPVQPQPTPGSGAYQQPPGTGAYHPPPGYGPPTGFGTPAAGSPGVTRPPTGASLTPESADALARLLASF